MQLAPHRAARRRDAGRAARGRSTSSTTIPTVDAYPRAVPLPAAPRRRSARCSRSIPTRTPTACTRSTSVGSCSASPGPRPCTPLGIQALLVHYKVPIEGQHVVILGRGLTIGRPLAILLSLKEPHANATVTRVPHRHEVPARVHEARPTSSSRPRAGPSILTPDMVRPGAAVVGAGDDDGRAAGRPRCRRGVRGGRGLDHAPARWRRPDDACDAAAQHRRGGRAASRARRR